MQQEQTQKQKSRLDQVCQILIPILGISAIFLLAYDFKIGFILGLISQPFWLITSLLNRQWGVFIASLGYTVSWGIGIYANFLK